MPAKSQQKTQPRSSLWESAKTILIAVFAAAFIHSFLLQPFYIPSGSMVPTMLVGDYLLVNKFAYGISSASLPFSPHLFHGRIFGSLPKRGTVVVFNSPTVPGETLIKRVIGLPGDKIQLIGGQLFINGQQVPRTPDGTYVDDSDGGPVVAHKFIETLPGGKSHPILKLTDDGFANNTPIYTVPPGDVFLMGDNRDNSEDSRFLDGPVGYVPSEDILGPATIILGSMNLKAPLWQFWRWPQELRWNRFFHPIH